MRILLTGATGFIGRRLTELLLAEGLSVIALGRRDCPIGNVENIRVPALAPSCIEDRLAGRSFDAVFHLAAAGVNPRDRDEDLLTEINGRLPAFMALIAARCGAGALVISGSSAEYRSTTDWTPLTEDSPLEDQKPYGASKASGGKFGLATGARHGIPVAVMRLFNVFGPGEASHRLLPSLISGLSSGRPVLLSGGTQVRDFVYVDDVCAGLMITLYALLARRLPPGAYNLCTGKGNTVREFSCTVARLLGAEESLLQFGALPLWPDEVPFLVGDPSRLRSRCGWSPKFSMETGLAAAVSEFGSAEPFGG